MPQNLLTVLLLAIALVGVSVVLLSVGILLKKGGRFPSLHVSGNKALRQRGIHCAQTQDYEARHRTCPVSETSRRRHSERN